MRSKGLYKGDERYPSFFPNMRSKRIKRSKYWQSFSWGVGQRLLSQRFQAIATVPSLRAELQGQAGGK